MYALGVRLLTVGVPDIAPGVPKGYSLVRKSMEPSVRRSVTLLELALELSARCYLLE
jgi:hypothetical protein